MEAEHTDLKSLKWDSDEDGIHLIGQQNFSRTTAIVAQHLSEIDAKAIVKACTAYESNQRKIKDLVAELEGHKHWINGLLVARDAAMAALRKPSSKYKAKC